MVNVKIKDLVGEYKLITDSQDIKGVVETLGIDVQGCSGLFVKLNKSGDSVEEVWGFIGIVPMLNKAVIKLWPVKYHGVNNESKTI
jgi:hypothetical protein